MPNATGTFLVQLEPQPLHAELELFGRRAIQKRFEGDLFGESCGEMLSVLTSVKGSAGYVAIERFTGTLHGKTGSFVLQHSSVMDRARPTQQIRVVPDSGTAELEGLSGSMTIEIVDGQHRFAFEYALSN